MARKKLLHLKSGVVNNGIPKLPTSDQIEFGEIAINYADGYETLAIKNSSNGITTFSNDNVIMDYVDNEISANTKEEVSVVYSGGTGPDSGSTIEIYIDENIDPEEVDVYTKSEIDTMLEEKVGIDCAIAAVSGLTGGGNLSSDVEIGLATTGSAGTYCTVIVDEYGRVTSGNSEGGSKEVMVKYSGGTDPESGSTIEIYIDEDQEIPEVDIYTQSEVDQKIADVVAVTDETSGYTATMVVDESTDLEIDFYSKSQIDVIVEELSDDLKNYVDSATSVVQTTGSSTTAAMSQSAVTEELTNKVGVGVQSFTTEQKTQARTNIGAVGISDISSFENKVEVVTADSTSLIAEVNKYYRYDTAISTLNITLPVPNDITYLYSIIFSFETNSSTPNITFSSTAAIKKQDGWAIDASSLYEINAVYNGSFWALAAIKLV